jgi:hypothetical protein
MSHHEAIRQLAEKHHISLSQALTNAIGWYVVRHQEWEATMLRDAAAMQRRGDDNEQEDER